MQDQNGGGQRKETRERSNKTILWRRPGEQSWRTALTLETSKNGLAFAWRGSDLPAPGAVLSIRDDINARRGKDSAVIVKRVDHAHEDLVVIAAKRVLTRVGPLTLTTAKPSELSVRRTRINTAPVEDRLPLRRSA
jgi:hypothetical protein